MTDAGAPELPEAVAPPAGETAADAPNQPPSSSPDVAIEDAPALEEVEDAAEDGEIMPAEGDWPGQVEVTGTQPAPTTEAGTVAAPAASSAPPAVQGGAKRRTIQWPADGPPRVNKPEAPAAGGATPETPAPGAVRQGPPGLSSAGMKTATAAAAAAAAAAASASMAASSGGFLQQPVADSTVQPSPGRGSAAAGAAPGAAAVSPQPQAARGGRSVRGTERVTTRGQTRGRGRIAKGSGGRGAPPGGSGPSA